MEGVLGGDYSSITRKDAGSINNEATIGYEAVLWRMANALRGSVDAAEYNARCSGPSFSSSAYPTLSRKLGRSWCRGIGVVWHT